MRLALVAPFGLRVKGTASARVMPLARALAAMGYEVSVWIPPYDSPEDGGSGWEDGGVNVVNLPCSPRQTPGAMAKLGWELAKAVRAWSPDLIHVFKPKGPSGLAAQLLRRMPSGGWRPPLIIDTDDWEGKYGWNDDPRLGYGRLQKALFGWQERHGLTRADAWTAASDCLRQRAVRFGAPPERVWVVPNGVAIDDWPYQPWSGRRRYVVLYTRFAGVRAETVRQMWDRVLHLSPASRLMIVGKGLGGEERSFNDAPGVDPAGWLDLDSRRDAFSYGAVAIAPWSDTPTNRARSSVKVRELMASGLPVVGTAVGELPGLLSGAGVVVPPDDAGEMAAAVVGLLQDPDRARRLGVLARERAAEFCAWNRIAVELDRIYGEVLA